MKLTILAGTAACTDGSCPTTYDTSTDRMVVQGYAPSGINPLAGAGHQTIEVPTELSGNTGDRLAAADRLPTAQGAGVGSVLATDQGTLVLTGLKVADAEALAQLNLPDDEFAIEIDPRTVRQALTQLRWLERTAPDSALSAESGGAGLTR